MIEIRPVRGLWSLRQFINLPYRKYRGHPHWVPQLKISEWELIGRRTNPFYKTADVELFTAWERGRLAGRIAAIDDHRHNAIRHDNLAAFGFFEAESADTARALLGHVERWAAARGRSAVRGPLNPSLNFSAGLQVDAFDTDPYVFMPWTPPEYPGFVEGAGYRKVMDLYCWLLDLATPHVTRAMLVAERFRKRHHATVRSFDVRRFKEDRDELFDIFCAAWKNNWGFVPPTRDEWAFLTKDLKFLRIRDLVLILEIDGRPVGCAIVLPDVNQVFKPTGGRLLPGLWRLLNIKRIATRCRPVATGVLEEYRQKGALLLLMVTLVERAARYGYREAEFSWILEHNVAANTILEKVGARRYKTYRLYEKPL